MEVKIAAAAAGSSLQCSHPTFHHPHSSSPQALTASTSSPSSPLRRRKILLLECRYHRRPLLFGTKLHRSKSSEYLKPMRASTMRRSCSANLDDSFPPDDFFPKISRGNDASRSDYFSGNQGHEENRTMVPDGSSAALISSEEETSLWNSFVEEAGRVQSVLRDESLDRETIRNFVSPAGDAKIQEDDYADYLRTELVYRIGLTQDPNNSLLLANYAQFLFLVAHDYDRAEEYFKKATAAAGAGGDMVDAEAYNKYATFLWVARNDLWAAEETYLDAISADPSNTFYAANYAHFLWNTGGEDTCFPLDSSDGSTMESSQHDDEV